MARGADLFFIVNPRAGFGVGAFSAIAARLRERRVPFAAAVTTGPGDARTLGRLACRGGFRAIVCVGGDGTVNEVVNGFLTDDGTLEPGIVLGHIPTGTAQDFARSAGIPLSRHAALDRLLTAEASPLDVGRIRFADGRVHLFVNVMGAGFDAEVADRAAEVRGAMASVTAHLVGLVSALATYRPREIRLTLERENESDRTVRAIMVVAANGPSYAGVLRLAPQASLDDGLLDVVAFRDDVDQMDFFLNLGRALTAGVIEHEKVESHRARSLTLEGDPSNLVQADGEVVGRLPARVDVLPRALQILR